MTLSLALIPRIYNKLINKSTQIAEDTLLDNLGDAALNISANLTSHQGLFMIDLFLLLHYLFNVTFKKKRFLEVIDKEAIILQHYCGILVIGCFRPRYRFFLSFDFISVFTKIDASLKIVR